MKKHPADLVADFHEAFEIPHLRKPQLPDSARREMRIRILREEFEEYLAAEKDNDLVEIADALADIVYVAMGTALEYGIPLDRVIEEVHASNMSKLGADGKPIHREDGKVIKGPAYRHPDVQRILREACEEPE